GGPPAGEVEPLLLFLRSRHPGDLPDLRPGHLPAAEGGVDQWKLLQAPREEDELVGAREVQVLERPLGGVALRSEGATLLHLQEVEGEGALGHLALSMVEIDFFNELL